MALAAPQEQETREQLERLDEAIEEWVELLQTKAEELDPVQLDVFVETAERLALALDQGLPPEMDPAAVAEIRGILIGALRNLRDVEHDGPLDVLDDFLVRAESIRHIIRDALDEDFPAKASDVRGIAEHLVLWLPGLPKRQIAELLGIEPRTFYRWEQGAGRTSRRAALVVRLVQLLKEGWSPEGVYTWFQRPRPELEGKRPIDVLDDPAFEPLLARAVREGRAQHGH